MTWRNIHLAQHCPSLLSLHLTLFVSGLPHTHPSDSAQWDYAASILSMTSPHTLTHLTLGLFCNGGLLGLGSAPDWTKLDSVLALFAALRRVQFQKETKEADGAPMAQHVHALPLRWQDFIRESLPLAQRAGILHFC